METGEVKVYYVAVNTSVVRSSTQGISYLHGDWLGSTVLVTTTTGQKDSSVVYYPYGRETTSLTTKTDKFYTGQRKDTSSNLYFYNARYYNSKTGHFVSADKAAGGNRYAYVSNNPVMKNDPSGNWDGGGFPRAEISASTVINVSPTEGLPGVFGPMAEASPYIVGGTMAGMVAGGGLMLGLAYAAPVAISAAGSGSVAVSNKPSLSFLQKAAMQLFSRFGNKELLPAMKQIKEGEYQNAIVTTTDILRNVKPGFTPVFTKDMPEGVGAVYSGGTIKINPLDPIRTLASRYLHEGSHLIDDFYDRSFIKNLTMSDFSQQTSPFFRFRLATEIKSNLAQVATGMKTWREGAEGVVSSSLRGTDASIFEAIRKGVIGK